MAEPRLIQEAKVLKALILGATGMVAQSLTNDEIKTVLTVGRRKSGVSHTKLMEIEHDNFLDFSSLETELIGFDIVFYCLGVYQSKVSKKQFWEITVDYLEHTGCC